MLIKGDCRFLGWQGVRTGSDQRGVVCEHDGVDRRVPGKETFPKQGRLRHGIADEREQSRFPKAEIEPLACVIAQTREFSQVLPDLVEVAFGPHWKARLVERAVTQNLKQFIPCGLVQYKRQAAWSIADKETLPVLAVPAQRAACPSSSLRIK